MVNVEKSSTVSLSFFDEGNITEIKVNSSDQDRYFEFYIKKELEKMPSFDLINHSNITFHSNNQLFLQKLSITGLNVSLHVQIRPEFGEIGYLAVLKYGDMPVLNKNSNKSDVWRLFCPKGEYTFYLFIFSVFFYHAVEPLMNLKMTKKTYSKKIILI